MPGLQTDIDLMLQLFFSNAFNNCTSKGSLIPMVSLKLGFLSSLSCGPWPLQNYCITLTLNYKTIKCNAPRYRLFWMRVTPKFVNLSMFVILTHPTLLHLHFPTNILSKATVTIAEILSGKKCARMGFNGFHIKWIIGTNCNWKNQNPGSRFGATS